MIEKISLAPSVSIIMQLIAFVLAFTFHEYAHALMAYNLGDDTAARLGRLSLNPLVHIDAIGFLLLFTVGIGWASPVPIDFKNFKYPRLYGLLVGFAGPAANFIIAIMSFLIIKYMPMLVASNALTFSTAFLTINAWINVMLGTFNLIPFPPLDGSYLLRAILPESWLAYYQRYQFIFFIALLVFLMLPVTQYWLHFMIKSVFMTLKSLIL